MMAKCVDKQVRQDNDRLRRKLLATYDSLKKLIAKTKQPTIQVEICMILNGIDGKLNR